MTFQAAVGRSRSPDAVFASQEATSHALSALTHPPHWLMVFSTTGYDLNTLIASIRELTPQLPLVGCSTEGTITTEGSCEDACALAVLAVHASSITPSIHFVEDTGSDPARAGAALAEALQPRLDATVGQTRLLCVFPDGVTTHHAPLIQSLHAHLPSDLHIIGGTAGDMLRFERTWQFADDRVMNNAMSALLLTGDFDVEIAASHGCEPIGLGRTVTRAEDGYVYEIDNTPAWSVFSEYLDDPSDGLHPLNVAYLSMAQHLPDSDTTIIHNPLLLDDATGALFFPGGLAVGDHIQLAIRNPEHICQDAITVARHLRDARDTPPSLLLQLDCAGRGRLLYGERTSERLVHPLREVLGESTPWIGFHTYGEIGPGGSERVRFHNYTVVLCALYAS